MGRTAKKTTESKTAEIKTTPKEVVESIVEKSENPTIEKKVEDTKVKDKQIAMLTAQLEAQQKAMEEMMAKMQAMSTMQTPAVQIIKDTTDIYRKIKVVSCCPYFLNLSTEQGGGGILYKFPRYGHVEHIKFGDLEKCVHHYRTSFERGDAYICDIDAVNELGLADAYQNLYNADELNDIIHLKNGEIDVDKICNMGVYDTYSHEFTDTSARDNIIDAIINNIAKGERYDRNLLFILGEKLGIDIDEKAKQIKEVLESTKEK